MTFQCKESLHKFHTVMVSYGPRVLQVNTNADVNINNCVASKYEHICSK